ncbi:MAG TPA: phosphoadenosine phosphosulfate reductase family protein [Patescibacteria group bacterium]|nr:phosphoadenosine phosphosulfate reductase family protein [Patescibacteria group bacterium]
MQDSLESQSEFIIKEAKARFKNPVILWAGGKDSTTMLTVARQAFARLKKFPFPVMLIDTNYEFKETYEYMEKYAKEWKLDFIRFKNEAALKKGINPFKTDHFACCNALKTEALAMAIRKYKFDAVLVGIRWDEHGVRGKESYFSWRDNPPHMRVHPMLNWSEKEIWNYLKKNKVAYNPLYDRVEHSNLIFRSIGCWPCTKPVSKKALEERSGRALDKEELMEDLRALGYM